MTPAFIFLTSMTLVYFITRDIGFALRNAIFTLVWFTWLIPDPTNPFVNMMWCVMMFFITEVLYRVAKYHFK